MVHDTIFALSSGAVPSGVAVIRLSGPSVCDIVTRLAVQCPEPRKAALRYVRHPGTGELIDQALVLYFPGPQSFTGEDCAEFHCHGGRAVVQAMLSVLSDFEHCRLAEAGEFSRRAFENGKIDLTAVEGLADLIHAETENQRKQAMRQASGAHKSVIDGWRQTLLHARSMIEAELDFSDEEDIPGSVSDQIWPKLVQLRDDVVAHLLKADRGERLRNGLTVVLVGHPNAGKSSLLNWFAKRDVAIVTEEAGTTRDLLELHLDIEGYPVTMIDTAGLRDSDNIVEREGIRRAREKSLQADLLIEVVDVVDDSQRVSVKSDARRMVLMNKLDRIGSEMSGDAPCLSEPVSCYPVSVKIGLGMDAFYQDFVKHIEESFQGSEDVLITRKRHESYLRICVDNIELALISHDSPIEIRSEYLRQAGDELGKITEISMLKKCLA